MNLMWRAHRAVDRATRLPGLEAILRRRYDRLFESNVDKNLFRGVFPTFEAAQQAAPASRPVGYDNPSSAAMYADRTRRIHSHDYPTLFWLGKLLAEGCTRVFDLGGHIGLSYYAYRDYLDYPAGLRWLVHDVPAVVENGRRIAAEQGAGALSFDERFESAEGQEVLFSAGALQYLPQTLAERLAQLASPPRHLVLNLLPLHDRLSYFTLQSIGTAFCPYRITALAPFLEAYAALGYRLVDRWRNPERHCDIPFHPDHCLDGYHGFYFRRDA